MKILMPCFVVTILCAFFLFSNFRDKAISVNFQQNIPLSEVDNPIIIEGAISHSILKTANGCGIGNFLIPTKGDSCKGVD